MAKISLSNESKSSISLSNEDKYTDLTFDDSDPTTWDEQDSKWDAPEFSLEKESKSKISLSNTSK